MKKLLRRHWRRLRPIERVSFVMLALFGVGGFVALQTHDPLVRNIGLGLVEGGVLFGFPMLYLLSRRY